MNVEVSLILPAYNEASRLRTTVEQNRSFLAGRKYAYEIVIAEDGSTDGTDRIARQLSEEYPEIRHIHHPNRLGRGAALKLAFRQARGSVVCYTDVDLATPVTYLCELVESVRSRYDLATGSRMLAQSAVQRSAIRKVASVTYNLLVRILFRSRIHDHQCGFKGFSSRVLVPLLDEVEATHWFWDTEVLVRAQRKGLRIKEFPIAWNPSRSTKVNLGKDVIEMGLQTMRLWMKLNIRMA